ncbi:MAG TPA: VOC family protein [Thermoanaerobaculia bacterium]|nr:VOC family protein [Thermoanaerobaculia bacterium]
MNMNPYLIFAGNCAEAMKFYEQTLGGTLTLMKNKDVPPGVPMPPGSEERTMHARLEFDGGTIMASDNMVGMQYDGMKNFSIAIAYDDLDEGKRIFEALAEGGRITMPFDKTFWVEGFGMCVDRYGTPWMVNGGKSFMS